MSKNAFASDMGGDIVPSDETKCRHCGKPIEYVRDVQVGDFGPVSDWRHVAGLWHCVNGGGVDHAEPESSADVATFTAAVERVSAEFGGEAPAVSFNIIDQPEPADVERYRERLARSGQPGAWVAGFLAQYVRQWAQSGTISPDALREALAVATVWQEISTARPVLSVTCATCGAPLTPAGTHDCQPRIVARGGAR